MAFSEKPELLEGHTAAVSCCVFNKNGQYCLSGSQDKTVRLWNPHRKLLIKTYTAHSYDVGAVAVSKDNSQFISGGGGRRTFVWDVGTGNVIRKFRGHEGRINAVAYNADDSVMASGSYDKLVMLWDGRSRSTLPIQILKEAKDSITSIIILAERIVTASVDGSVRVYDLRADAVTSAAVSGDGNCVLANCMDSKARLLSMDDGELLNTYEGHSNKKYQIGACFSYTDAEVLSGSDDGRIYAWDLVTCKVNAALRGHRAAVTCLAFHPSKTFLVSGSVDKKLMAWSKKPET